MTRLTEDMIAHVEEDALKWDETLRKYTGMGFTELAAAVSGQSAEDIKKAAAKIKVAAVPITAGLGIIGDFAKSVLATPKVMGFETFVTETPDVDGIYEARNRGADIVYMADEVRYMALDLKNGKIGENNYATAAAYIELLDSASGGLAGEDVLVLGFGIIGREMCRSILKKGGSPVVFVRSKSKLDMAKSCGYDTITVSEKIREYKLVADATNEAAWLGSEMLHADAVVAAPGIPLSLSSESRKSLKNFLIHDQLEIGTAAMLGLALKE